MARRAGTSASTAAHAAMLRTVSRLSVSLVALVAAVLAAPGVAPAQTGQTVFSIDLDTSVPGVQDSHSVPVGQSFHLRLVLESLGIDSYGAYQATVNYPKDTLEATGFPSNWGDVPNADAGGNVLDFTSGPLCDPSPTDHAVERVGQLSMTCAEKDFAKSTANAGDLVDLVFKCKADGTATLDLSDINDTYLLDTSQIASTGNPVQSGDVFKRAIVTCGAGGSTTPGATGSTTASAGGTASAGTPSSSATSVRTPAGSPTAAGAPSSSEGGDTTPKWPWIIGAIVAAVIVLGGAGAYVIRRGRA